ncbi:MAG TPA: sugar transferase [Planctomycetota bacterium]|nr:sugar transferase [Planctomycetota bacterium]
MIARQRTLKALALTGADLALTATAFLAAMWLRSRLHRTFPEPFSWTAHLGLLPIVLAVWAPLLWRWGLHRAQRTDRPGLELWKVFQTVAAGGAVVTLVALVILRRFELSRAFLGLFLSLDFVLLALFRLAAVSVAHHQRKRGYDRIYVLVVGAGKAARRHLERLGAHPEWGVEVRGVLSEGPRLAVEAVGGAPVRGTLADLAEILRREVVDEVHFAVSRRTLERLDEAIRVCDDMGVTVRIVLGLLDRLHSRPALESLEGTPLLTLSSAPRDAGALLVKRVFDVVVSAVALVASSPILLAAALAIKITSPDGPIIFRQKRSGMNGRVFTLYKFRTMVPNAEALKASLEAKNEMDGPVFKIRNDPRVTRVGRILRKLSIDELPQLWNVLRGDMSIVGPRPPIPSEVERYERWQRRRLSMRPGITCIWQVSGRNNVDFKRWMEMDLEYIDNWSLALDFKILLKTIPAVLSSRGAS